MNSKDNDSQVDGKKWENPNNILNIKHIKHLRELTSNEGLIIENEAYILASVKQSGSMWDNGDVALLSGGSKKHVKKPADQLITRIDDKWWKILRISDLIIGGDS